MIVPFDLGSDAFEWFAVAVLVIMVSGIALWYLWSVEWALTKKPVTGAESYVGKVGVATRDFTTSEGGEVSIDGVIWKAKVLGSSDEIMADSATGISRGDSIVVVGVSSNTLVVKKS